MPLLIAIAMLNDDIAPDFRQARGAMLVAVEGARATPSGTIRFADAPCENRVTMLAERGARVVICGSFPEELEPFARACGLRVRVGASGRAVDWRRRLASTPPSQLERSVSSNPASIVPASPTRAKAPEVATILVAASDPAGLGSAVAPDVRTCAFHVFVTLWGDRIVASCVVPNQKGSEQALKKRLREHDAQVVVASGPAFALRIVGHSRVRFAGSAAGSVRDAVDALLAGSLVPKPWGHRVASSSGAALVAA